MDGRVLSAVPSSPPRALTIGSSTQHWRAQRRMLGGGGGDGVQTRREATLQVKLGSGSVQSSIEGRYIHQ